MKHIYEKPTAVSVLLAGADILTISNADGTGNLKTIDWNEVFKIQ